MLTDHAAADFLQSLFHEAVRVADPIRVIPSHLPEKPSGRVIVIGAGKASARMAEAVEQVWGACEGLVITRYGYARPAQGIKIVEAAHPVADHAGMQATQDMLNLVKDLGPDDLVLALISGGGSALLCAPAAPLTLVDKQDLHRALLTSGAPIGQMNIIRKHTSLVKGGQFAAAAYPAQVRALMISDVPDDVPADIASGATVGETSSAQDALDAAQTYNVKLPSAAIDLLKTNAASNSATVVAPDDPRLSNTQNHIIAAPSQSLAAAEKLARAAGFKVRILGDNLEGEARDLACEHAHLALELQKDLSETDKGLVLLSGGECTVTGASIVGTDLPEASESTSGGPNAEYTLAAALALKGAPNIHVLACDTDGVDGAAEVAGALAGPHTLQAAKTAHICAQTHLDRHDSHSFFETLEQQIITGPTLTNVNDFRAILIQPCETAKKEH